MSIFKGPDGVTSLELLKTDYIDENGSESFGFTCKVNSRGFSAKLENIWFYKEDILNFTEALTEVLSNSERTEAVLQAMSDFTCSVIPSDSLGHFSLKTTLENPVYQNSASLVVEAETQTLSDLLKELNEIVQNP